jgi:hypothetical protein
VFVSLRGLASCAALLGVVVASPASCRAQGAPASNGWRFTWTTTTRAEGGPAAAPAKGTTSTMAVQLAGGRARVDEAGGRAASPMAPPPGGYMLLDARGPAVLVDPAAKKALVLDVDAGGMAPPGMAAEVDSVRVVATPLGAGETLLGRPTRKWRIVQSYVLRMRMGGQARVFRSRTESEVEVSTELASADAGFGAFTARFGRGLQQEAPLPGLAPLAAATTAKWPAGVPLRLVQRSMTVAGGDTLRVTTEGRMTTLARATVPPASLGVPAGYETLEASRLMQQRRPASPAPAPVRRP